VVRLPVSREGNETHTAYDGLEALEAAASLRPDIGLPLLNGYDVARKIGEQPWGKQIMLLVALTGWGRKKIGNVPRRGFRSSLDQTG